MKMEIQEVITDIDSRRRGYVIRDGFVFAKNAHAPIFDVLVVRNPLDVVGSSIRSPVSERSLEDHIQLICEHRLEKAIVICRDLSFITQCPSLNNIAVYPSVDSEDGFDFSPLYQMESIQELYCATTYGYKDQFHSEVDYSRIKGLSSLTAAGVGHWGYEKISRLEKLWISGNKQHEDFSNISCSTALRDVTLMQCGLKSLNGLHKHPRMEQLALYHCRSLTDVSSLSQISESLISLTIEGCPKIKDFSVLEDLRQLKHIHLYGNNPLPNLSFLKNMKKLETFCFTMNVQDGDLTLCKDIPYVSCRNRNHYNYKDQDLPKTLPHSDN